MTIYAVGDIHGQLDMLKAAHERIETDRVTSGAADAPVVFIGDYNDRGPDSPGVLDWLIQQMNDGAPFVPIAGNHDRMLLGFVDPDFELDPKTAQFDWLADNLGGRITLQSYGVDIKPWHRRKTIVEMAQDAIPDEHLDFLRSLPLTHAHSGAFFTHAGINPDRALDDQLTEDLFWIRQPFLDSQKDHGALIVHGHTPVRAVEHAGNRLNIDVGAGFGRRLAAVVIEDDLVFELTEDGRAPIKHRG